jgi:hypothetical protein
MNAADSTLQERHARGSGTSYKFQRLREELRAAVGSGQLSGKLPGERILSRRFKANAKTLSKALTDLAAEGVLERIIGRGTFVKGALARTDQLGRWLLLTDASDRATALTNALAAINPDNHAIQDVAGVRPSFLGQFRAVIDLSSHTPEWFLRDLTVRNMPIVLADREPGTLSLHAVLVDVALGGARLARELLLLGHRSFLVVERHGSAVLARAVQSLVSRYDPDAVVDTCAPDEFAAIADSGATAVICDSASAAVSMREAATAASLQIPEQLSLAAVGCCGAPFPASGYYVSPTELAAAIAGVLRDTQINRPTVLWLNGERVDQNTVQPIIPVSTPQDSSLRLGLVV